MIPELLQELDGEGAAGVLRADLGDLIQSLIVFLFLFGPLLGRIFGKDRKKDGLEPSRRSRPVRSAPDRTMPPPTVEAGAPTTETVTWKDLLEGRVPTNPNPAPLPEPEEAAPELESAQELEPALELEPARGASRSESLPTAADEVWDQDPFAFESEDLVPDEELKPAPAEEQLEASFDLREESSAGHVDLAGEELELAVAAPTAATSKAPGTSGLFGPGGASRADLRRAVLMAEVLGGPLALREEGGYPGPAAART